MKTRKAQWLYTFLWVLVRIAMFIWHPFTRFIGREHIPQNGCLIVANHSSMADPIWVLLALGSHSGAHIMAKKEVMGLPILPGLLLWAGVFGVDRGEADLAAVKHSLEVLKSGENLLIFPEGTRVKPGKDVTAKSGAALIAQRTGAPVLPMYITQRKRPFCPIKVVFGEPYQITAAARRITAEELETATVAMMDTIYRLGEA